MPDPTKLTTNLTREDVRHRIVELRKERSHHLIDESDYIESVMQLIDTYTQAKVAEVEATLVEAHRLDETIKRLPLHCHCSKDDNLHGHPELRRVSDITAGELLNLFNSERKKL